MVNAEEKLRLFQTKNNIFTKGPLSVVVQFTRMVREKEWPTLHSDFNLYCPKATCLH